MSRLVYLASKSPRRSELLKLTGIDFVEFDIGEFDEDFHLKQKVTPLEKLAENVAIEKAKVALSKLEPGIFITADTIVIADDGSILGKPSDVSEAEDFLDRLAGNWHTVATGVAIAQFPNKSISTLLETTRVKFSPMTAEEISDYIATGEPFDKAGGYGIQGKASIYIEKIEGCYFNVVGFPLHSFWKMWKTMFKK